MKKLSFLLIIFLHAQAIANMANPIHRGTLGGRPFVNQYVDVVHEDLFIKIDKVFNQAHFQVKYHINSSRNGVQIPFLFYASGFLDSFHLKIDGKEVTVQEIPYYFRIPEGTKFKDFSYFFEKNSYDSSSSVVLVESPKSGFHVNLSDMIYFETDISKGEHIIEVTYRATKWNDTSDWVDKYSFRYALSPAKYWKSFGTLTVKLDATKCNKKLTSNLGKPAEGHIDSVSTWYFDSLPVDILQINYDPEISPKAKMSVKIGPHRFAFFTGGILAIAHLILLIWYRKRNPMRRFSLVVILGSILVPLIFLLTWMYSYDFINAVIGQHASGKHGYTFFILLLYPIIFPCYWALFWVIDKLLKNRLTVKTNPNKGKDENAASQ